MYCKRFFVVLLLICGFQKNFSQGCVVCGECEKTVNVGTDKEKKNKDILFCISCLADEVITKMRENKGINYSYTGITEDLLNDNIPVNLQITINKKTIFFWTEYKKLKENHKDLQKFKNMPKNKQFKCAECDEILNLVENANFKECKKGIKLVAFVRKNMKKRKNILIVKRKV